MKKMLLALLMTISCKSLAGELVRDATIVEVANTYSGGADFTVKITGGTGVCSGNSWIIFPEARKHSDSSFDQAFSIALSALAAEKKVRIHSFGDNTCTGASFISISK